MQKDECILVDEQDNIVGSANKYKCHKFTKEQPHGLLHRAFSVFLFSQDNQLLLQQRANSKITFPGVWTNTCCSHQLHGYSPTEVDQQGDVADASVMGVKVRASSWLESGMMGCCIPLNSDLGSTCTDGVCVVQRAAVRKLEHELGITPHQVPVTQFKFLTRLHYCAADVDTYGPDAEWGEHEVCFHSIVFFLLTCYGSNAKMTLKCLFLHNEIVFYCT